MEVKNVNLYKVVIMEYERGWAYKVNETKYFDTEASAKEFVREFNKCNTAATAPDWYKQADYIGKV